MDLDELIAQRKALNKQISEYQFIQRGIAINDAKRLIAEYDITALELGIMKKRSAVSGKLGPKFRNPETGETWSGRGRAPAWILGQEYARFAITS